VMNSHIPQTQAQVDVDISLFLNKQVILNLSLGVI